MKRFFWGVFVLLILVFQPNVHAAPAPLNRSDFYMGSLEVFAKFSDIKQYTSVLGEVIRTKRNEEKRGADPGSSEIYFEKGHIHISKNGSVWTFDCTARNIPTPRGISVGDSLSKVISSYGLPVRSFTSYEDGLSNNVYIFEKYVYIFFATSKDGIVRRITMGFEYA